MSVYIGPSKVTVLRHMAMYPMIADTHAELQLMARRLNMPPSWLRHSPRLGYHYLIAKNNLRLCVRQGCQLVHDTTFEQKLESCRLTNTTDLPAPPASAPPHTG